VATLVFFHAHPDDEAIATGGTMATAAAAGHDVVLVVATRGEQGEPVAGVLGPDEPLWQRRVAETHRSAELLGVSRVAFLGYEDSGMMGEASNNNPACFWQADVSEASDRLAVLLDEVGADVLTVYDAHGGYGHPDHIQVHRVGYRAAAAVGVGGLYEATMNRTHIVQLMSQQADLLASGNAEGAGGAEGAEGAEATAADRIEDPDFGSDESVITHAVDVSGVLDLKRAALMAHASQIADDSFFLTMPPEAFALAFGTEWYISTGSVRGPGQPFVTDLLPDGASGSGPQ
jgi:LmbE family N-acetylglucosaminyl deacetylase